MDDKDEARLMAEQDLTPQAIADELGVPVTTVYDWLSSTTLLRERRERRNAMIIDEYERGTPILELCSKIGVSQGTVYSVLHNAGITLRRHASRNDDDTIVAMYVKGAKLSVITSATGRSTTHIYAVLAQAGVPLRNRPRSPQEFAAPGKIIVERP